MHERISELLEEFAAKLLHIPPEISSEWQYTDDDIMNATIIFSNIIGNVHVHRMIMQGLSEEDASMEAEELGGQIHELILEITGFDTKKHYDK